MRAEHLWEWLPEHIATEAAAVVETETEGGTSGPEERESATKGVIADWGEERDPTKWDMVVNLV